MVCITVHVLYMFKTMLIVYVVHLHPFSSRTGCVCVCLGPEASVCDEIWAMCQALCISVVLRPVAPLEGALKQLSISHGGEKGKGVPHSV